MFTSEKFYAKMSVTAMVVLTVLALATLGDTKQEESNHGHSLADRAKPVPSFQL
jgi:hypothetical protein